MKVALAGRYARALVRSAASRGRAAEAVAGLLRAASFFRSADGKQAEAILQSSRVPRAERESFLGELAETFGMTDEVRILVSELADLRSLRAIGIIARRAAAYADAEAESARAELRTARPIEEGTLARIRTGAEKLLGRGVRLEVKEDPSLLAGIVLKVGNRVWDGSLSGRLARARETLGRAAAEQP